MTSRLSRRRSTALRAAFRCRLHSSRSRSSPPRRAAASDRPRRRRAARSRARCVRAGRARARRVRARRPSSRSRTSRASSRSPSSRSRPPVPSRSPLSRSPRAGCVCSRRRHAGAGVLGARGVRPSPPSRGSPLPSCRAVPETAAVVIHPPVPAAELPPLAESASTGPFWKKELSFSRKPKAPKAPKARSVLEGEQGEGRLDAVLEEAGLTRPQEQGPVAGGARVGRGSARECADRRPAGRCGARGAEGPSSGRNRCRSVARRPALLPALPPCRPHRCLPARSFPSGRSCRSRCHRSRRARPAAARAQGRAVTRSRSSSA